MSPYTYHICCQNSFTCAQRHIPTSAIICIWRCHNSQQIAKPLPTFSSVSHFYCLSISAECLQREKHHASSDEVSPGPKKCSFALQQFRNYVGWQPSQFPAHMSGERTVIWLHNDDHSAEVLSSIDIGRRGLLTPHILDLLSGKSVPSGTWWDGPRPPLEV